MKNLNLNITPHNIIVHLDTMLHDKVLSQLYRRIREPLFIWTLHDITIRKYFKISELSQGYKKDY